MGQYKKSEEKRWNDAFNERKIAIMKLKNDGLYAPQIVEKLQEEPNFMPTIEHMRRKIRAWQKESRERAIQEEADQRKIATESWASTRFSLPAQNACSNAYEPRAFGDYDYGGAL